MALSAMFSPASDELTDKEIEYFYRKRLRLNGFRDWFMAEFGSVVCREVQKHQFGGRSFNFMDEKELMAFRDFPERVKCSEVVTKAALKVAQIMIQEESSSGE